MACDLTDFTPDLSAAEPACVPSATLFPEDDVLDQVRSALQRGARVFKIQARVGGFDLREPILEVWGLLADAGVPVVIHVGSGGLVAHGRSAGHCDDRRHRTARGDLETAARSRRDELAAQVVRRVRCPDRPPVDDHRVGAVRGLVREICSFVPPLVLLAMMAPPGPKR